MLTRRPTRRAHISQEGITPSKIARCLHATPDAGFRHRLQALVPSKTQLFFEMLRWGAGTDAQLGSWGEMLRWGAGETCSPAPPQYSIPRWITVSHNRYLERQTCKTVEKNAHVKRHLRNEILNKISSDPKLLCKSRDMAIAVDERVRDGTDNREGLAFNPRHHRDQSHLLGARVCGTFAVQFMGSAICRPAARAPASSDTAGHGGNERGGSQMGPARRTLFHSGAAALNLSCTVIRHLLPPLSGSNK